MFSTRLQSPRTLILQESISMTIYPTVLYIKQHSITGLKYFGKTTTKDPYKYKGSGVDWIPHLKEYGSEHVITTIVFGPCTDSEVISEFALSFSRDNNIVESKDWANRKIENGLDGAVKGAPSPKKGIPTNKPSPKKGKPGKPHSDESKQKMSDANRGKPARNKGVPHSIKTKQKMSDAKKGRPSSLKGRPSSLKGRPSPKKGKPSGKQQNPSGPRPKVECPHCGKIGGGGAMAQWHFDNCRMNPYF